jgi:CubicO group peptidase (beta-lactamase class C family)
MTRPDGMTADSWQEWPHNSWAYQHIDEVLRTKTISRGAGPVLELAGGDQWDLPGLHDELEALCTDGILVLRGREIVVERYLNGMTPATRHLLQSVTKSMVGAVVGRFIDRGALDPSALCSAYVPALTGSAYADATLQQALDMLVAVVYDETYQDHEAEICRHDRASGWRAPREGETGAIREFLTTLQRRGEHGRTWQYCSANTDVLAWVLEEASGLTLPELLSQELWAPMGAEHDALMTVDADGFSLASGGGCVTLRDLARFGRLFLEAGVGADGSQVIPRAWIDDVASGESPGADFSPMPPDMGSSARYRDQVWRTGDEHGCYFGVGIFGQYVWINPSTDTVVAKLSTLPDADDPAAFMAHRALLDRLSSL